MADNLAQLILDVAFARPELEFYDVDAGESMSLAELVSCATRWAALADAAGISPGARVAIVSHNSIDMLIDWAGAQFAGLETALINPAFPADLVSNLVGTLSPVAIAAGELDLGATTVTKLPDLLGVDAAALRERARTGSDESAGGVPPGARRTSSQLAGYMLTSGSEGVPKFCAQSHGYFLQLGQLVARHLRLSCTDRVFTPLPFFHVNPLGYAVLGAVTAGADLVFARRFSASNFWSQVESHRVTALVLHTGPVQILKSRPAVERRPHAVRVTFLADQEFLEQFDIDTGVAAYGSTEAGGISHIRTWRRGAAGGNGAQSSGAHGYVAGQPRADFECGFTDDGEILLRELTPSGLFSGYLAPSGDLDTRRDTDGWFHTGDLGADLGGGRLAFYGRAKESLRIRGEFVPLDYLERKFSSLMDGAPVAAWHPDDAAAELALFVEGTLTDDRLASIRDALPELPGFMRPQAVTAVSALPRDPGVGKVLRRQLNQMRTEPWTTL